MENATTTSTAVTVDITPTWGEFGRIYASFAESGERKACRALRPDMARAMAAAQALRELRNTLMDSQQAVMARVMAAELGKAGY